MVCTLPVAEVVEVVDDATVVVEDLAWFPFPYWACIMGKEETRRAVLRKLTMFADFGNCLRWFSNGYKNNAMDEPPLVGFLGRVFILRTPGLLTAGLA